MSTTFPNGLDVLTNPTATQTLNSPSHSEQHANANDAIEALEAKVGVTGSAVTSSLDYRVAQLELAARTITTDTSAAATDKVVLVNAAGGAITYTLPDLAANQNREIIVLKIDSSDSFVTVDGNGSDPINGASTKILVNQFDGARLFGGPTAWYVLP